MNRDKERKEKEREMKRLLFFIFSFIFIGLAYGDTRTVTWINNGSLYNTTTCTIGGDLTLPATPTPAYGYHFIGWDLPDYTFLEYIQSTGTQYIDTGLRSNNGDIKVTIEYEPTSLYGSSGYACVFGRDMNMQAAYNSNGSLFVGDASNYNMYIALDTKSKIEVVLSQIKANGTYYLNGANTGLTRSFAQNISALLFAGAVNKYFVKGKVYSLIAEQDGSIIQNLVPAKRNSDNAIGMYDNVNDVFYTNAGTGDFIAGPVKNYIELEYLQSTGTQYIDTGYKITSEKGRVVTKFVPMSNANDMRLCGSFSNSSRSLPIYMLTNNFVVGVGETDVTVNMAPEVGDEYIFDITADNGTLTGTLNNTAITPGVYTGAISESTSTFWLFDENQRARYPFTGKIYYFQLYDNDVLVRDLIPVKRIYDNTLGMYDKVHDVFYPNSGTGTFVAGPEK